MVRDLQQARVFSHITFQEESMNMEITRDQVNEAMKRFLEKGGSVKRIDHIAGEPVLGKDYLLSEEMLEMAEVKDSELF